MLRTVARWTGMGLIALAVTTADQASKLLIASNLVVGGEAAPLPALADIFTFTHVHNTGGAFSVLPQAPLLFTLVSFVMIGVLLVVYRRLGDVAPVVTLAVGLQLGGALGNLIDRLRLGYVIDFMHVHGLPVFNIADVALVSGTLALFLLIWWTDRRPAPGDSEVIY